ncbi:DNA repair protein RadC [Neisseriaceae bacterium ESL0693]|nr:DNA repair protein RadC [Neisseriaceae bacterium ESL0693]
MSIKDWPETDRPREKLRRLGSGALNDTELLAILLRTGIKGISAVDLARQLIKEMGSLRNVLNADSETLCQHKGMGLASYAQFAVIREISQRMLAEEIAQGPVFNSPDRVSSFLRLRIGHEPVEVCLALLLNQRHELLHTVELARGTVNENTVYIRQIAATALEHHAAAIILAHNHPGQSCKPSEADKIFTDKLKQALEVLNIHLLDHFIVTQKSTTSMMALGLI